MGLPKEKVREYLMELSAVDRRDLAYEVLDAIGEHPSDEDPAEVEAAWAEEIRQRVEEIRNGTAETYSAEEVMADLRARYG